MFSHSGSVKRAIYLATRQEREVWAEVLTKAVHHGVPMGVASSSNKAAKRARELSLALNHRDPLLLRMSNGKM